MTGLDETWERGEGHMTRHGEGHMTRESMEVTKISSVEQKHYVVWARAAFPAHHYDNCVQEEGGAELPRVMYPLLVARLRH